jgi:hypothetical protein
MIGMIQILTYLLCVYLVFKGFEILQIALMSPREDRGGGLVIGVLAVVISIAAAFGFATWSDSQAAKTSSSMPGR